MPNADDTEPAPHLHYELWSADGARHLCQGLEPLDCHGQVRQVFGEKALPRYAREVLAALDEGESAPATYPPAELPETGFAANPPQSVTAGSAFAVPATWEGDAFEPGDLFAFIEGHPLGVIEAVDGAWIIAAVPLAFPGEQAQLVIGAADAYGQSLVGGRTLRVNAREGIPAAVALPGEVLELHSEDNRESEGQRLGPVIMSSMERREPRWNAPFVAPLEGTVTRRFGQEAFRGMLRPAHPLPGIAIQAQEGAPVRAANGGRVALVEDLPIRGRTVVFDHGGGVISIYAHLSVVSVAPGDIVDRGQEIGNAGSTGATAVPQLRWEVHVAGIPTDPLEWLDQVLPNRQPPPSG